MIAIAPNVNHEVGPFPYLCGATWTEGVDRADENSTSEVFTKRSIVELLETQIPLSIDIIKKECSGSYGKNDKEKETTQAEIQHDILTKVNGNLTAFAWQGWHCECCVETWL